MNKNLILGICFILIVCYSCQRKNSILYFKGVDYYEGFYDYSDVMSSPQHAIYTYVFDTTFDVGIPLLGLTEMKGTKNDCKMPLKKLKKEINQEPYAFWSNCKYLNQDNPYVYTMSFAKQIPSGKYPDTMVIKNKYKYINTRKLKDSLYLTHQVFAQNKSGLDLGILNSQMSFNECVPGFSRKIHDRYSENSIKYFDLYWQKLHSYLQPLSLLKYANPVIDIQAEAPNLDYYRLTEGYNTVPTNDLLVYDSVCIAGKILSEVEFINQIKEKQVVIFGENHYDPRSRRVINTTLDRLKDAGFKDIFFEALQQRQEVNINRYLRQDDGFYTNENEMAGLVRKAIRLGFRIHAYDEHYQFCDTCTTQLDFWTFREQSGMNNIQDTILKYDIEKFVVVSGYGHANKMVSKNGYRPLGNLLVGIYGEENVGSVKIFTQEQLNPGANISYVAKTCQSNRYDYEIVINPDFYPIESNKYKQRGYEKLLNIKKYKPNKNVVKIYSEADYKEGLMVPVFTSHPASPKHHLVPIYKGKYVIVLQDKWGNKIMRKIVKI